jgi:hypothetical protein
MFASTPWFARSIVGVLCASLAVALMGATSTSLLPPPTIVIFSFTPADGADPSTGPEYAKRLGAALTTLGGVKVIMADAATVPADYLHTAKTAGADYYLMGHIAPAVKNSVPVIEQVVSARSGIVVWSDTAHISSDSDVVSQAPVVRNAVTSYAARGYATILNATPGPVRTVKPATTPAPKKVAATAADAGGVAGPGGIIIGPDGVPRLPNEAYGYSSKPTAPPKVYASASRPSRFVVLSFAGKSVTPNVRDYTVESLVRTLKTHGQSVAEGDPAATGHHLPGPDVCADTGGRYLVFGSIEATSQRADESNNYVNLVNTALNVTVYNCAAGKFEKPTVLRGRGMPWQSAVDNATSTAVNRYLMKLATIATSS